MLSNGFQINIYFIYKSNKIFAARMHNVLVGSCVCRAGQIPNSPPFIVRISNPSRFSLYATFRMFVQVHCPLCVRKINTQMAMVLNVMFELPSLAHKSGYCVYCRAIHYHYFRCFAFCHPNIYFARPRIGASWFWESIEIVNVTRYDRQRFGD